MSVIYLSVPQGTRAIDINNTDYTISIGTYTFIGKKDTPNYGQMISASTCE